MTYDAGSYLSGNGNGSGSTWTAQYFEGSNIYVYIRGKQDPEGNFWNRQNLDKPSINPGMVLVNCHLDSVATSYGATDDGMACVSMLQLLSHFTTDGHQLENGIVLLFNNAEEDGLLGSRAFSSSPLHPFCRAFVNLEGVGAGGRAMLFQATDYGAAKAYSGNPHPLGSVIANDGYDSGAVMSGTDYEIFANVYGWSGLDIAFYKPRSRYHTVEDDARHTSTDSIWHMLSAALAATQNLSQRSIGGSDDRGSRRHTDKGVWFDWLGCVWVSFRLVDLFTWSTTLVIVTPLAIALTIYALVRKRAWHLRDMAWADIFRFPLALAFATTLTSASLVAVANLNPFIIYSSSYAVWAMALSSCYLGMWVVMRGCSGNSALVVQSWLFVVIWAFQVSAVVAEGELLIASLYPAAVFHLVAFLSLMVSLLEQLGLPRPKTITLRSCDTNGGEQPVVCNENEREDDDGELGADDDAPGQDCASATRPLLGDHGGPAWLKEEGLIAISYQKVASSAAAFITMFKAWLQQSCEGDDPESRNAPGWLWLLQFLILAPVHLTVVGGQDLSAVSAIAMTGVDGSSLATPFIVIGALSIVIFLPLAPFFHRITHHVPLLLLLLFVGTSIYNLSAFPFSASNRYKFIFKQVVDLDRGSNTVILSGSEEYLYQIVDSIPEANRQLGSTICQPTVERRLTDCIYDASQYVPQLENGVDLEELIKVETSVDEATAHLHVDARETRGCWLDLSRPIFNFTIQGGAGLDPRLGQNPPGGHIQHIQVWRRGWTGAWNVSLQLVEDDMESSGADLGTQAGLLHGHPDPGELRLRGEAKREYSYRPLEVTARCVWGDANEPKTIPALRRVEQYMPPWAIATRRGFGLVEVQRTYKVV
ncbi:hypothetical protein JDV02_000830 [Purpureocillium takamizusanense]|nr:uncharacterized protein JDV02_000830 [Purpureocillium takamizusanense]UNI14171.1 hypothetical protein JDV02_000830 [Purpureocillium takamizusanense]